MKINITPFVVGSRYLHKCLHFIFEFAALPSQIQAERPAGSAHADPRLDEEAQVSVSQLSGLHERVFTARQTQAALTDAQQRQAIQL